MQLTKRSLSVLEANLVKTLLPNVLRSAVRWAMRPWRNARSSLLNAREHLSLLLAIGLGWSLPFATSGSPIFQIIKDFTPKNSLNGSSNPYEGLILDSVGSPNGTADAVYGAATGYDSSGFGTIFKLTPDTPDCATKFAAPGSFPGKLMTTEIRTTHLGVASLDTFRFFGLKLRKPRDACASIFPLFGVPPEGGRSTALPQPRKPGTPNLRPAMFGAAPSCRRHRTSQEQFLPSVSRMASNGR